MTTFFIIVALVHFVGLYVMLFALRRAPVAVEDHRGFRVVAQPEETHEGISVLAHTA